MKIITNGHKTFINVLFQEETQVSNKNKVNKRPKTHEKNKI